MSIFNAIKGRTFLSYGLASVVINIFCTSIVLGMDNYYYPKEEQQEAVKIFIDYGKSDNTERYLRTEIQFVDHVRDPYVAQIHVLITDIRTGSGGRRYNISFIGKERFSGQDQNLFQVSPQSDTDDKRREGLAQIIKMGLMPYVSQTSVADQVKISYDSGKLKPMVVPAYDAWNYWIFNFDLGGGGRTEETRNVINIYTRAGANRVTDEWKTRNGFSYRYEEENFTDDGKSLKSFLKNWTAWSSLVKSLSDKWSTGLIGRVFSTTYKNIQIGASLAPAIEYNFFPWREVEKRQLTIGYRTGVRANQYIEETLYEKIEETLLYHSLTLELAMIQPWGEIDLEIEALQYPTLKNFYSLKSDTEISVRVSSAFSFFLNTRIEKIHDQIYLPRKGATIDEILLRRKQLATTFEIEYYLGVRFTFGSIYNNVVNYRL